MFNGASNTILDLATMIGILNSGLEIVAMGLECEIMHSFLFLTWQP